MENSILLSTKEILGLPSTYTPFDLSVITFVCSALADISQLGVGPLGGLTITDESTTWDALGATQTQLDLAKTLVYLKVKMLFDPPTLSFMIDAANEQIAKHEWRLSEARESLIPVPTPSPIDPEE